MHWKDKYSVSKSLLKLTYEFREEVKKIREPFVSVTEFWEVPEKRNYSEKFYQMKGAYMKRTSRLEDVRASINELLLDAEVVWWDRVSCLFEPLFRKQNLLFSNLSWYLESLFDPWYKDIYKKEIIYSKLRKEDTFWEDLQKIITKIEDFLKPNMK